MRQPVSNLQEMARRPRRMSNPARQGPTRGYSTTSQLCPKRTKLLISNYNNQSQTNNHQNIRNANFRGRPRRRAVRGQIICFGLELRLLFVLGAILLIQAAHNILLADAIECETNSDCGSGDKVCHENKCICVRERPIEMEDRCLPLSLLSEQCTINDQCMGNSRCLDGICSCPNNYISLYNPSSKIFYCHPKRGLNEECNHDSQCPSNSYCSTKKAGCLCQNGYAPSIVSSNGISAENGNSNGKNESLECLAKFCSFSNTCESEFHQCEDNLCKCLASHFDPTSAKCYKFGSKGGKLSDELLDDESTRGNNLTSIVGDDSNFYSILKDLTENSDRMWLVLIILISLSILLLAFIFALLRRHYLGYCWTAHKKEYEPNNKSPSKNGYFNKNTINNKSFRQKSGGELDEEQDAESNGANSADRSSLVSPMSAPERTSVDNRKNVSTDSGFINKTSLIASPTDKSHSYVKVNMNDQPDHDKQYLHHPVGPLSTSTSTPV